MTSVYHCNINSRKSEHLEKELLHHLFKEQAEKNTREWLLAWIYEKVYGHKIGAKIGAKFNSKWTD